MKRDQGISLIVLVITIIVIIILAGAVILSLSQNNPVAQASKATYLSDVKNFQTELDMYVIKQYSDKTGAYDSKLLNANVNSVTYNGLEDNSKTMNELIPSLGKSSKYNGLFEVVEGKLVFEGMSTNEQNWAREIGIGVITASNPKVTIISTSKTAVNQGTDITYTVKFSSNSSITNIDLTDKIELIDNVGVVLSLQPVVTIGTISGTNTDTTRQVDIIIKTDRLANGEYKLKIKSGVVTNLNNLSNSEDSISLIGFDIIDITPPENPIMSASPSTCTNGDVTVSVTYSSDSLIKEYSFDSENWINYTLPFVINKNNTTVYSRGKDSAGNESGHSTLTISNIDRILPTVGELVSETAKSSIKVTINGATDENGIKEYEFYLDGVLKLKQESNIYTYEGLDDNTNHIIKYGVRDNSGNLVMSSDTSIKIDSNLYITSSSQLMNIFTQMDIDSNYTLNKTFVLNSDVDLAGIEWSNYRKNTVFKGILNGNGFEIKNFTVNGNSPASLFYTNEGTIENIGIASGSIQNVAHAAPLVYENKGIVSNCYNKMNVSASTNSAGLVFTNTGTITCSYNTGIIKTNSTGSSTSSGGIAQNNISPGIIEKCYNLGAIGGDTCMHNGGIVTLGTSGNINDCYNKGVIRAMISCSSWDGGLTSHNWATISNSYNVGYTITSSYAVGTQINTFIANSSNINNQQTVDKLNNGRVGENAPWILDTNNVNGGYPILKYNIPK